MVATLLLVLAQVVALQVAVDADAGRKPISPYLYGRNNTLSDDPSRPLSAATWQMLREAGVRLFRENSGNNATKYNWRRKLSSHPDWYNNVYAHDWDYEARSLEEHLPGARGMWAFQLIGRAAATGAHNFNDWGYNGSQWWEGVHNNWAGGGGPNAGAGDPDRYLMPWPPDSTVAILDHWFGDGGLGLDPGVHRYWNMDNEPEIWDGTHDDVMPTQLAAEAFMQRYFAVAKKARAKAPGIRLAGPVTANEWQWYNWRNDKINAGGRSYTWLEFFIKRVGEEQAASGVRLLDVLDLHFYPGETNPADIVQLHRVWFDPSYVYPGANGVKRAGPGGWDDSIRREYVFARARAWLDQYLGPGHGVTFGVSETGVQSSDPNVTAVWYASTLGVFADEGVELFTPWDWKPGMWEVLHLFSRYAHDTRVAATTSDPAVVSAHASLNAAADSLSVVLINRSLSQARDVAIDVAHFDLADGLYMTRQLAGLPAAETFVSHTRNAQTLGFATVADGAFTLSLPPLSVTAVLLNGRGTAVVAREAPPALDLALDLALDVYPNPAAAAATVSYALPAAAAVRLEVFDLQGRRVASGCDAWQPAGRHTCRLDAARLPAGVYVLRLTAGVHTLRRLVTVVR